jgi:hypothetical protein
MVAIHNRFHYMSETFKWTRTHLMAQRHLLLEKKHLTPEQIMVTEGMCILSRNQIRIHFHKIINPWWDETDGWLDA